MWHHYFASVAMPLSNREASEPFAHFALVPDVQDPGDGTGAHVAVSKALWNRGLAPEPMVKTAAGCVTNLFTAAEKQAVWEEVMSSASFEAAGIQVHYLHWMGMPHYKAWHTDDWRAATAAWRRAGERKSIPRSARTTVWPS